MNGVPVTIRQSAEQVLAIQEVQIGAEVDQRRVSRTIRGSFNELSKLRLDPERGDLPSARHSRSSQESVGSAHDSHYQLC